MIRSLSFFGALFCAGSALAAPDLRARHIEAPAAAVAGETVDVTFTAYSAFESADFSYRILATPTGASDDGRVLATETAHLAADAEGSFVTHVSVPADLLGRTYFAVELDPDGIISEANELDDVAVAASATRVRAPAVDLRIDDVRALEPFAAPGGSIHVDVSVTNAGELAATFDLSVRLSKNASLSTDDDELAVASASLAPHESRTVRVSATTPRAAPTGDYFVGAILDPSNVVAETREGDARLSPTPLNLRRDELAWITPDLPGGTVFIPYFARLSAEGGDGRYRFRVSSGRLPEGVTLAESGLISGAPLDSGSFDFEIAATSLGLTVSRLFHVEVEPSGVQLVIATPSLEKGTVSLPYHLELVAAGGEPPYSWSALEIPTGLDLAPSGVVTGVPLLQGTYRLQIQVTDALGNQDERTFDLVVESPNVVIGSGSLPSVMVGTEADLAIEISGGRPPYRVLALSTPPPGLSVTEDGHLVGAPTEVGIFTFRVRATDSSAAEVSDTALLFIEVTPPDEFHIATLDLPDAIARRLFDFQLEVIGGVEPISFRLAPGETLPDGFEFVESTESPRRAVRIVGSSVYPGSHAFVIVAEDATGRTTESVLSLTVIRPEAAVAGEGCSSTSSPSLLGLMVAFGVLLSRRRRV